MSVGFVLLLLGALALSGATLRAHTLPRWPAILLILSVVSTAALHDGPVGPTLFFASLTGFGIAVAFGLGPETVSRRAQRPLVVTEA